MGACVCLVHLTLIVFMMGGRWPYSCCLVGCCPQDLFSTAHSEPDMQDIAGVLKTNS